MSVNAPGQYCWANALACDGNDAATSEMASIWGMMREMGFVPEARSWRFLIAATLATASALSALAARPNSLSYGRATTPLDTTTDKARLSQVGSADCVSDVTESCSWSALERLLKARVSGFDSVGLRYPLGVESCSDLVVKGADDIGCQETGVLCTIDTD